MIDPNAMTQIKYLDELIAHNKAIFYYLQGRLWDWIDLAIKNNPAMIPLIHDALGTHNFETKQKLRRMMVGTHNERTPFKK